MTEKTREKEWLTLLAKEAKASLVPLKMHNYRKGKEIIAGQGKMCSFSGNM